jgi:hypothetical protein
VAGHDTLGQRLGKALDRMAAVQIAKRRGDSERTRRDSIYGMTGGAVGPCEHLAALHAGGSCLSDWVQDKGKAEQPERHHSEPLSRLNGAEGSLQLSFSARSFAEQGSMGGENGNLC